MGLFHSTISAITDGLAKTRQTLAGGLRRLIAGKPLSDELIDEIEHHLLTADVGVATTRAIVDELREVYRAGGLSSAAFEAT